MTKQRLQFALTLLTAAAMPLGCMSTPVQPGTMAVNNPLPLISLGNQGTAAINLTIVTPEAFKTKAFAAVTSAMVTYFNIDLIQDQGPAAGADYSDATMGTGGRIVKGGNFLHNPAGPADSGTIPAGATPGAIRFTNVVPGTYRVRVKAQKDTTTPPVQPPVSKPDSFFTNNSGWTMSGNTATVTNGTSTVSYSSGSQLTVSVNLNDGVGDQVDSVISVTAGTPPPAIATGTF